MYCTVYDKASGKKIHWSSRLLNVLSIEYFLLNDNNIIEK